MRDRLILAGWVVALALVAAAVSDDTDQLWSARAGEENLTGTPLVRPDSWSWAPVDGLFVPNSPGWNVVLALAYRVAGLSGLYLVGVVGVAALLAAIAWGARTLGAGPLAAVVGMVSVLVMVPPALSPRAATPAAAVFIATVVAACRWAMRRPRPPAWLDVGVVLVGAGAAAAIGNWIHLSWPLYAGAAALVCGLALGATAATVRRRVALVAASVAGLMLGTLAGPYGLAGALDQAQAVREACEGIVLEWLPVLVTGPSGIAGALLTATAVVAVVVSTVAVLRRSRLTPPHGLRLGLVIVAAGALAGALLVAGRFITVAAVCAAPVIAATASEVGRALDRRANRSRLTAALAERTRPGYWRVILTAGLVVAAVVGVVLSVGAVRPADADAATTLLPRDCRLYSWDPAAVLLLRPDVTVWHDRRFDYWGRDRNIDADTVVDGRLAGSTMPIGTNCVLLAEPSVDPSMTAVTTRLDADPAWSRAGTTGGFTVWVPADQ